MGKVSSHEAKGHFGRFTCNGSVALYFQNGIHGAAHPDQQSSICGVQVLLYKDIGCCGSLSDICIEVKQTR